MGVTFPPYAKCDLPVKGIRVVWENCGRPTRVKPLPNHPAETVRHICSQLWPVSVCAPFSLNTSGQPPVEMMTGEDIIGANGEIANCMYLLVIVRGGITREWKYNVWLAIVCLTRVWQPLFPLFCDKTFEFAIQTWQISLDHYYVYVQTYFLSQLRKMLIFLISSYCKMCILPTLQSRVFVCWAKSSKSYHLGQKMNFIKLFGVLYGWKAYNL